MAFNLANERIQDPYEQLVQISGSTLLNGIGTAIPAITNINSVSSSYAITASYAQYAVSASHEIVHELSSSYADTASFANFATTASYINPTFISASAAASGFGSGGGDSFPYTGSAVISGSLVVSGSTFIKGYYSDGFSGANSTTFQVVTDGPGLGPQTALRVINKDSGFGSPVLDIQAYQTLIGGRVQVSTPGIGGYGLISAVQASASAGLIVGSDESYTGFLLVQDNSVRVNQPFTASIVSASFIGNLTGTASFATTATIPTLQQVTNVAASSSNNILMTNPNGNQTLTFASTFMGSQNVLLRGAADLLTTFDSSGLFGAEVVEAYTFTMLNGFGGSHTFATNLGTSVQIKGSGSLGLRIVGGGNDPSNSTIFFTPASTVRATLKDTFFNIGVPVTASIISASSGFIGNGSGLTNINTEFGAELYFNAADYVIDLPGDFNDPAVTVSISQSGVYLISSSKVPPYGTNGPRVNLQWCPQQLGSGVAKVKFFIPSLDTGNGVSYKQSVSCSADYQYIWNSTTTPSGSTATTIARSLTLPQYSNGTGVTNMIKGQDGFVYFSSTGTPVPSQGYIYTGPSIGLLV